MKRLFAIGTTLLLQLAILSPALANPAPVEFSMVAVKASNVGVSPKQFGAGLGKVKSAIQSLSYDTFEKISSSNATIPFGEKTEFFINQKYTLVVEPTAVDERGRIRMNTVVMMKSDREDGKLVKALDTVLVMAPDKHLNLGGLKLEDGDLIVVLSVR